MDGFDHPFFAKPWRRTFVITLCLCWGVFELALGQTFWAIGFIGMGLLALRQFWRVDWSKYDKDS